MISNLKWESLEQRCAKAKTVLMNKIIHNLVYNLQNIYLHFFVYHLIVELDGLQPSGLYIHEQMYITLQLCKLQKRVRSTRSRK